MGEKIKVVVITGPTATGKSALACALAGLFNGEVINADSMQIYRFMDIGTAKPGPGEMGGIAHHLIDIVDPDEHYTAARFRRDAGAVIKDINARGAHPVVVGGTGLYIKALTDGLFEGPERVTALREKLLKEIDLRGGQSLHKRLEEVDPVSAGAIHPNNIRRIIRALEVYYISKRPISEYQREHAFSEAPYNTLKIGIKKDRDRLYADIESRVERMMKDGLVAETGRLIELGYSTDLKPMGGLGYKEIAAFLKGHIDLTEAVRLIKRNTRHYAKRQMTWFNKDPDIKWFYPEEKADIIELVRRHLL